MPRECEHILGFLRGTSCRGLARIGTAGHGCGFPGSGLYGGALPVRARAEPGRGMG
ncbi:hypothetical protein ANDA3_0256 [plant metagenome]|uniref:Uncharacterized protein n=1 Tax=plant metagenome TaxID=1297885 RepID=A0A484QVN9_9ZZZZ